MKPTPLTSPKPSTTQEIAPVTSATLSTSSPITYERLTNRYANIFFWRENPLSITIVGAGSIGSNLCLMLARMGIEDITVIDDDDVEDHNLGHQAYRISDLGGRKVEALQQIVKDATGIEIKVVGQRVEKVEKTDILVLGVDNMESRKKIFENSEFSFYVDGRMGGQTFNVFAGTAIQSEQYIDTLYSDEAATEAPCGGKSIGYISYAISAIMGIVVKKMILGESFPFEQNFCSNNIFYLRSNEMDE